jgi:outer membrane protein assembly factor BamA
LFRYKFGGDIGGGLIQSETTLPFDQRFYLGGASSLRGFTRNQAGPMAYALRPDIDYPSSISSYIDMTALRDQPGQWIPVGGDVYWAGTAELHFPLRAFGYPHISVIGFTDVGRLSFWDSVLQETYRPTENGLQFSFGTGLRWTTSVGPIAIDLGINPNAVIERGESYVMPYFSFGNL